MQNSWDDLGYSPSKIDIAIPRLDLKGIIKEFRTSQWYGCGLNENYSDRKESHQ